MVVNEKTRVNITIGAAVAGGIFLVTVTVAVFQKLTSIRDDMSAIRIEMTNRIDKVDASTQDRWTKTAQSEWAARFQINNPTIRVPDPKDPARLLGDATRAHEGSYAMDAFRELRR